MLGSIRMFCRRFLHDESGATAIEYGLIAALLSLVILTAILQVGPWLRSSAWGLHS